jgi:hypothetical protein
MVYIRYTQYSGLRFEEFYSKKLGLMSKDNYTTKKSQLDLGD